MNMNDTYYPLPDSQGGWRTLFGHDEVRKVTGIDTNKLDDAFEYIKKSTKNGGLLVLKDGWLVYEKYFGKGQREAAVNLASCGKSITSIAMGIFISENPGLFPQGLEQKVFTPTYFPREMFPLSDPKKAEIKLGQLLAFTAGIRGNNPVYINGRESSIDPLGTDGWPACLDMVAFGKENYVQNDVVHTTETLWCEPGAGYSYATSSIHLASVIIRHISGIELQDYLEPRLAKPMGWGRWGYAYRHSRLIHNPGGGGIICRPTDMLRFGYLLLQKGKWGNKELVPREYIEHCSKGSFYNPHFRYSLQFDINTDSSIPSLPSDVFWKEGSGGHCIYIVPSLNLVVWKLGGRDDQYAAENTGFPEIPGQDDERDNWEQTVDTSVSFIETLKKVIDGCQSPFFN